MATLTPEEMRSRLVELASDLPSLQEKAEAWLLEHAPSTVPALVAALDDDGLGSVGQWRVLLLLRQLRLPETLPAVRAALRRARQGRDPIVLPGAMEALAAFRSPEAVADMAALLGSDDPDVVRHAAVLLGGMGDPTSAGPLSRLLESDVAGAPYAAAQGLLRLGTPEARAALARHLAGRPDESVRRLIEGAGIRAGEGG